MMKASTVSYMRKHFLRPFVPSKQVARTASTTMTTVGFEASLYIDKEVESSMLERSIHSGCKYLLANRESMELYQLIADLAVGDEIDPTLYTIGHRMSITSKDNRSLEFDAIEQAQHILKHTRRDKLIDFISVPLLSLPGCSSFYETINELQGRFPSSNTAVYLPTELLSNCISQKDTDEIISILSKLLSDRKDEADGLQLLIATNVFTAKNASRLHEWCTQQENISVTATEILRCDSRRPGLMNIGTRQATGGNEGAIDVESVVEVFQKSMDSCMKVESEFLENEWGVKKSGIPPTDICFAHVLAQTQADIVFPEEWDYIKRNMVEPKLNDNLEKIRSDENSDKKAVDWARLYLPLAKYMFHTFSLALEAKKQDILKPVIESVTGKGNFNYHAFMLEIIKYVNVFKPKHISIQGIAIPSENVIQGILDENDSSKGKGASVVMLEEEEGERVDGKVSYRKQDQGESINSVINRLESMRMLLQGNTGK